MLALEGPLAPGDFVKVTGATTGQEAEYITLYDGYQKETRPTRDSAQLAQQNIRAAIDHGRREALPPLFATLNSTGRTLDTKLKAFDEQVKKLLPKAQWKKYEKDEKERRKALEEEQKEIDAAGWTWRSGRTGRPRAALRIRPGGPSRRRCCC